ncbi:ribonuclease R [Sphingomonas alba]|uniref:Ribonuclease R n=1 Tax=Sphingomonas alba TaxID=2908208 RepID=A0ABT0RP66_9SPHN|nr:ribonuclease R [Sphingomonas alba]MCL6684373.1 ribonuclease R [Sphingomonas alba]
MPRKPKPGLPTRKQVLDFIASSGQPAGKREIARAFGLKGNDKIGLKVLLKDMADEGLIDSSPGRAFHQAGGVPRVTVLRVASVDDGGNVWAVPEQWHADTPPPKLRVIERGKRSALALNDRILARTEERGQGHVAHPMKKLARAAELVLGVVRKEGDRFWLSPVDKKERRELPISDLGDAQPGDLVLCEPSGRPPRVSARVDAVLGDPSAPRSFSLIAIHKHGIRDRFKDEAIEEAKRQAKQPLGEDREDLTHLPIVAIDPADARDHDDAIWAKARDDKDGWDAIVAIADVSFYVRPGSELDREARARGNSVYFPDRVVPMLPEELSADICSLKEGQERAAMACHLHVGKDGQLKSWKFTRAKICVAANIAYEDAQAAINGEAGLVDPQVVENALKPLWDCWKALFAARAKREPLELDLPERRVMLDEKGRILSVAARERLDAHRLVEDYMIAANVAAARALEAKKAPVMYRVHETPGREKLVALKDYLATFDLEFALGQVIKPSIFNAILERFGDREGRTEIMEQLLRTQMQARYSPERLGHFGLALATYAHFTSPIRRYADLVVHRALTRWYKLGEGGLTDQEADSMEVTGELISTLERRAMEAERETVDRYVAAFLADQVGQIVRCRITGVQPFGFFATVDELGGDGLVLAADLGTEYFRYDEKARTLVGDETGEAYRVGQRLELRLAEANPVSGGLRFQLPEGSYGGPSAPRRDRVRTAAKRPQGRRGRPGNIRHDSRRR